jgi:F-box domain
MTHQAALRITITTLPTDVLSCIVRHIEEAALPRDQRLNFVAALRSTCRSLRNAVDASVTHATFHPNVNVAELRSTVHRYDGGCMQMYGLRCSMLYCK